MSQGIREGTVEALRRGVAEGVSSDWLTNGVIPTSGSSGPNVTRDPTSGRYIPQNATEWTSLLAGTGISNPSHLWLCQEVSPSNLTDSIGGTMTLLRSGTPLYQQAVAGWSSKGIICQDGTTNVFKGSGPNTGGSVMTFGYFGFPATSQATRRTVLQQGQAFATMDALEIKESSSPLHAQLSVDGGGGQGGASVVGTGDAHSVVLPCLLVGNTNAAVRTSYLLTGQDTLSVGLGSGATVDAALWLGGDNVNSWTSAGASCIYLAAWYGTNAELLPTQQATLMSLLAS